MGQPINPPDGWAVTAGTWGTDFQRDESVYLTSNTSVKMVGTSANTQTLTGPWIPLDGNGISYYLAAVIRSTNNTSLFTLKFEVYAADRTTLTIIVYLYNNAVAPTANAWLTASQELVNTTTSHSWGRFILTRATAQTASVYVDRVEIKKLVPRWGLHKTSNQALTFPATTAQVAFTQTNFTSLVTVSGSTNVTVYRAGLYLLNFKTRITGFNANDYVKVYYKVTDPILGTKNFSEGIYNASSAGVVWVSHAALYRHPGTTGGGSPIGCYIEYLGAASPLTISGAPGVPNNTELEADSTFTGIWLGVG